MFFALSKIFNFLFSPFYWIMILFVLGLVFRHKKWRRRCFKTAIILTIFFTNGFIIHQLTMAYQAAPVELNQVQYYNAGIVLGGFVKFDYTSKKGHFTGVAERFIVAARLYKQGKIRKILISGGSGILFKQELKEADFARDQFIQLGIPAADILIDNKSRNTYENAIESKKILDSMQISGPILLITSAMHMPRAVMTFEKARIKVKSYPCAYSDLKRNFNVVDDLVPNLYPLAQWEIFLKELAGLMVYKLTGKV